MSFPIFTVYQELGLFVFFSDPVIVTDDWLLSAQRKMMLVRSFDKLLH